MLAVDQLARGGNRLLAAMDHRGLAALARGAERVTVSRGTVLVEPDQPIEAAHFIESGVASVIRRDNHGERIELCMQGPESFAGCALVGGEGRWPYLTFVQAGPMTAIRIGAADLLRCLDEHPSVRALLVRAVQVQLVQIAEGLASAAWQKLDARLARWLLMYRDRMGSDRIEVTHEFMALMVGAQRSGITLALHDLEGAGMISASRGLIVIRDGARLEHLADGGYGVAEREQARLFTR